MLFKRMHLFRVRLKRNGWGKKTLSKRKGLKALWESAVSLTSVSQAHKRHGLYLRWQNER